MSENIVIAWISLTVSVKSVFGKNQKIILNNIFGKFSYNCLNGLMGSSGSGKTTLLKCLNGSNKYCISDESKIMTSNKTNIRKCFIYQNLLERVMTGLTVGQALSYSSKLKNSLEIV